MNIPVDDLCRLYDWVWYICVTWRSAQADRLSGHLTSHLGWLRPSLLPG